MPERAYGEGCIFERRLLVAEQLAAEVSYDTHESRQRAVAGISVTRRTLELMKKQYDCLESCNNAPKCSIEDSVLAARGMAVARWKPEDFSAKMEDGEAIIGKPVDDSSFQQEKRPIGFQIQTIN